MSYMCSCYELLSTKFQIFQIKNWTALIWHVNKTLFEKKTIFYIHVELLYIDIQLKQTVQAFVSQTLWALSIVSFLTNADKNIYKVSFMLVKEVFMQVWKHNMVCKNFSCAIIENFFHFMLTHADYRIGYTCKYFKDFLMV